MAQIAKRDNLTSMGKFLFYAEQPEVQDSSTFNGECQRKESGTDILGCYVNDRIYIYNVTDSQLDGIQEVTAAHELLHAVYQRMSNSDKSTINALVEAEYKKLQNNPDYSARMAFYAKTEPGERDNELHSIIGTEIASISPALEAHYAKYFNNRSQITKMFASYNGTFTSLSNEASTLSKQLTAVINDFKASSDKYNADAKQLNADIISFNQQAGNGGFSSQAEFNAQRQILVGRSDTVEAERTNVNNLYARYQSMRDEYNSIVTQSNNLYKSIDSSLAPAPKV